jgi:outer membrane protein assembly factor BamB
MQGKGVVVQGRRWGAVVGLTIALLFGQACQGGATNSGMVAGGPAASLVTLPSSVVVIARRNGLDAYQADGNLQWSLLLPEGDQVAAAPVAALSSVTFVRGRKAIYAISPTGQLLWQASHLGGEDQVQGMVALNDSTVALTEEDRTVVALTPEGLRRWTYTLPEGERLITPPAVSPNSLLLLRTATTLHGVDSEGNLAWTAEIAPSQP